MSTHVVIALLLGSGACVDPAKRFDDFTNRVVDAAVPPDAPQVEEVADISGQFLLSIDPVSISAGKHVRYIADATLTEEGDGYLVDVQLRALDFETLELVPEVEPITLEALVVNDATATFTIPMVDALIPGRANAIIPDLDVIVNGELQATIRHAGFWCGAVTGTTDLGTSLNGSTFGAESITAGTVGEELPPPAGSCDSDPGEGEEDEEDDEDDDGGEE